MRIVIYRGPEIRCLASSPVGRGGFSAAAGAQLDLDEVIGVGGYTVGAALGPLAEACVPADQPIPVAYEGLPADEDEE